MPLKRKLGIAAVLVVVVAAGLFVVFREPGPDSPPTATFVRYATNGVVIELVNHGRSELAYVCHRPWAGLIRGSLDPEQNAQVTVPDVSSVGRRALSNSYSRDRIQVICIRRSKVKEAVAHALKTVGIRTNTPAKSWVLWVDLPPP